MKVKFIAIIVGLVLFFGGISVVLAQSPNIDWEMQCLSGNVELNLLENGSVFVRCLLNQIDPTETATLIPTEIATETPMPTETVFPTASPTITPTLTQTPSPTIEPSFGGIVVDHTSLELFDQIPDEYLLAAKNLDMMFSDRSVGVNMDESLNCLASPSWSQSPSFCRRDYTDASQTTIKTYNATDLANGNVPELIQFTGGYNRSNWAYTNCSGDYDYMIDFFINTLAPNYLPNTDVLSCQYSYLNVDNGSKIMNYFIDSNKYDVYDLEEFIAQYPDKEFVFWTTSLARTIGTEISTDFNNQMREYAIENGKVLMDMADIISHDRNGNLCLDATGRYPVICRDYTTEINGGHLGSVSGGRIQMAKAFWVLMAQIAGWNP